MEKEKKYAKMADGSQIYYEKSGSGFPLFLLHGNGGNGKFFSQQVPLFEQHFTVYLIDSRGQGHSTNESANISFNLMAEDLATILALENIRQVDILGFSDGANLALVFASSYSKNVHRLILNSGNTLVQGVRLIPLIGSYLQYGIVWIASLFWPKLRKKLAVISLLLHNVGLTETQLSKITCPTLILVGKKDVIKLQHSLFLAKTLPNASFVLVKGSGHQLARQDPQRFNQEVLKFLEE